ncbi:methyltransferase domain-containing protein [Candidatus Peregrinibacteria bacterium]|nr:methyltransferase domain-containing protein [Candidatus Peregrinibacteria bacterium]
MKKNFKSEKTISATWDNVWKEEPLLDWNKDFISQLVYRTLKDEIDISNHLSILEAGCGSGRISLKLAKKNTKLALLDSSMVALTIAREFSERNHKSAAFVQNSIYTMAFKNESFDIVWNAGVLEHFYFEEQRIIIDEMSRVCKVGGKIIILVPYSKALLYRLGKWMREKLNLWKVGREVPLNTLKKMQSENCKLIREYVVGTSEQTFLLPKGFKKITKAFLDVIIHLGFDNFLQKIIGGYLLVSVFEKRSK